MNKNQLMENHEDYLEKIEGLREFILKIQREIDDLLTPEEKLYNLKRQPCIPRKYRLYRKTNKEIKKYR